MKLFPWFEKYMVKVETICLMFAHKNVTLFNLLYTRQKKNIEFQIQVNDLRNCI